MSDIYFVFVLLSRINCKYNFVLVSCSVGMFYDENTGTCKFCGRGTYQDKEGQTSCKRCPQVKLGIGIMGAVNITQCTGMY